MKRRLSTGRTGTWGKKMIKKNTQVGISSVLVLGVIAVLLTIVVPLVSRTVVDIRITKQQEDQARAFSVAETGLEQAMVAGGTEGEIDGIKYEVTKATVGGASNFYAYPKVVERDSPVFVWLVKHNDNGNFDPESSPLTDITNAYRGSLLWRKRRPWRRRFIICVPESIGRSGLRSIRILPGGITKMALTGQILRW